MDYPWGSGSQSYAGVTTENGHTLQAASGTLTVAGSGTSLTSVTYCGVTATAANYNSTTKKLTFNVLLPTGRNGTTQAWPFQGTFNGAASPVTISGSGTHPTGTGVGDEIDPWMATGN